MKFTINSKNLLRNLQIAGGAIGSNPVLPILEDFLFHIEDGTLTITATDLEITITTEVEVTADKDFTVAIPARILLDTLKALPEQPITFTVNEKTFAIQIKSSKGKYKLAGENGSDFPKNPVIEGDSIELESTRLLDAIGKTLFCTSNDELRPAMTGTYFQVDFDNLTIVTTDAHKLAKYRIGQMTNKVSQSLILPKKGLNQLKNILPTKETVKVEFNKVNATFSFNSVKVICRLIDARYPDYNAVIPIDNPNKLTVNRRDLQGSLKRIAIYANKTTNQVVLNIQDGILTVSAQDLDFSNEATEQLTCTFNGEPMDIGFNAKFLIEMLGVLTTKEIEIDLSTNTRAGIMRGVGDEEVDLVYLLMPVMLS